MLPAKEHKKEGKVAVVMAIVALKLTLMLLYYLPSMDPVA